MSENLHDIDDLFKNSIDGHAEEVPPDVWKNIDHNLDKKQAAFYKRKYFAIRAAAILLIFVGGITIAAILHFDGGEKSVANGATNETSVAKGDGADKVKIAKPNETVRKKESEEQPIVSNNQGTTTTPSHNPVANERSEQYSSNSYNVYSAEENGEVSAGDNGINQKNVKSVYQLPKRSSVTIIANERNKEATEQTPALQPNVEEVKTLQRTNYIDVKRISVNNTVAAITSLPQGLKSSVLPSSSASLSASIKTKNKSLGNWSVLPMFFINTNLNTLKDDEHFRDPRNNSREVKRSEQNSKSYTVGLGIQKQIGKSISIQTGAQYFASSTTIEPKMIFARPDNRGDVRYQFNCSSGNSYITTKSGAPPKNGDSIKTNFSKSTLSYLQVPLIISHKIGKGKFSFTPSAGFYSSFLLKGKLSASLAHSTGSEDVSGPIDGLKSMYLSGVIQPQLEYNFSDRLSFDLNPNLNFSLSPINKQTAVKTHQNMFGLGVGIRIKL